MDRASTLALAALGAAVAVSGCANILGFQDFTDDGGVVQPASNSNSTAGQTSDPPSSATSSTAGGDNVSSTGASNVTSSGGSTTQSTSEGIGTGSTGIGSSTHPSGGSTSSSPLFSSSSTSSSSTSSSSSSSSGGGHGPAGPCTFGTAYNGGGSFTYYWFSQGTYTEGGNYKTACGYTEPTNKETGSGSGTVDTVTNIADTSPAKNTYFAAIPGTSSSNFNTVTSCGACVEITGQNGTKIVATIVDECPTSSNPLCTNGHLDLSTQAFDQLGYSNGSPSGTTWKFVPCPVTGNIQAVLNSAGQVYLQNSVYPISTVNGQGPTTYGYFNVQPGQATVASAEAGVTITINIPSGGGDTGGNFTAPTGCY